MTKIILNADDFGRSADINAAVVRAHRDGILTSASLMVTEEAVDEAVSLAQEIPTLAVGLHIVVAGGRAALPPVQIPHIVDGNGRFPDDPLHSGPRYFLNSTAQEELARELQAQFERFAATGLPLSHIDGHLHMHVHPTVFRLLLPLAVRYGAQGFRLPRGEFWLAMGYNRRNVGRKAVWAMLFGLLCHHSLAHLRNHNLTVTHCVYGLMQTGQMQEEYVLQLLCRLQVPTAELYFHPSMVKEGETFGPNPDDLATLLSPAVRQAIQERGLRVATYSTLREE